MKQGGFNFNNPKISPPGRGRVRGPLETKEQVPTIRSQLDPDADTMIGSNVIEDVTFRHVNGGSRVLQPSQRFEDITLRHNIDDNDRKGRLTYTQPLNGELTVNDTGTRTTPINLRTTTPATSLTAETNTPELSLADIIARVQKRDSLVFTQGLSATSSFMTPVEVKAPDVSPTMFLPQRPTQGRNTSEVVAPSEVYTPAPQLANKRPILSHETQGSETAVPPEAYTSTPQITIKRTINHRPMLNMSNNPTYSVQDEDSDRPPPVASQDRHRYLSTTTPATTQVQVQEEEIPRGVEEALSRLRNLKAQESAGVSVTGRQESHVSTPPVQRLPHVLTVSSSGAVVPMVEVPHSGSSSSSGGTKKKHHKKRDSQSRPDMREEYSHLPPRHISRKEVLPVLIQSQRRITESRDEYDRDIRPTEYTPRRVPLLQGSMKREIGSILEEAMGELYPSTSSKRDFIQVKPQVFEPEYPLISTTERQLPSLYSGRSISEMRESGSLEMESSADREEAEVQLKRLQRDNYRRALMTGVEITGIDETRSQTSRKAPPSLSNLPLQSQPEHNSDSMREVEYQPTRGRPIAPVSTITTNLSAEEMSHSSPQLKLAPLLVHQQPRPQYSFTPVDTTPRTITTLLPAPIKLNSTTQPHLIMDDSAPLSSYELYRRQVMARSDSSGHNLQRDDTLVASDVTLKDMYRQPSIRSIEPELRGGEDEMPKQVPTFRRQVAVQSHNSDHNLHQPKSEDEMVTPVHTFRRQVAVQSNNSDHNLHQPDIATSTYASASSVNFKDTYRRPILTRGAEHEVQVQVETPRTPTVFRLATPVKLDIESGEERKPDPYQREDERRRLQASLPSPIRRPPPTPVSIGAGEEHELIQRNHQVSIGGRYS